MKKEVMDAEQYSGCCYQSVKEHFCCFHMSATSTLTQKLCSHHVVERPLKIECKRKGLWNIPWPGWSPWFFKTSDYSGYRFHVWVGGQMIISSLLHFLIIFDFETIDQTSVLEIVLKMFYIPFLFLKNLFFKKKQIFHLY